MRSLWTVDLRGDLHAAHGQRHLPGPCASTTTSSSSSFYCIITSTVDFWLAGSSPASSTSTIITATAFAAFAATASATASAATGLAFTFTTTTDGRDGGRPAQQALPRGKAQQPSGRDWCPASSIRRGTIPVKGVAAVPSHWCILQSTGGPLVSFDHQQQRYPDIQRPSRFRTCTDSYCGRSALMRVPRRWRNDANRKAVCATAR